jgi:hypothetical protein
MTGKPSYVIHHVDEKDVTVDWFFGPRRAGSKIKQLALLVGGWIFVVLPVVITASSLLNRDNDGGWWSYQEGFDMWDKTIRFLGILILFFVLGFLALHLVHRATVKERSQRKTYDEQRLGQRTGIADAWYADKFGPEALRLQQRRAQIEPYVDIETYELRGLYRANGVN